MQGLWRKDTDTALLKKTDRSIKKFIFTSGRHAIMHTLRTMCREDCIAVAEYSSQCVVNAVGRYTTPIPAKEVVENNINVRGIMVYEQWGWPFSDVVLDEVLNKYERVIFDCVDSPDALIRYKDMNSVVVSLSKCLGLKGGGLLLEKKNLQERPCSGDENIDMSLVDNQGYIHMINSHMNTVKHIGDIEQTDVLFELDKESRVRNNNLALFANSELSKNWPAWMHESLDKCYAGIVPLFAGMEKNKMIDITSKINKTMNIRSDIYNFNWSGSPLLFDYRPCIAFPIHSDIENMQEKIKILEKIK